MWNTTVTDGFEGDITSGNVAFIDAIANPKFTDGLSIVYWGKEAKLLNRKT